MRAEEDSAVIDGWTDRQQLFGASQSFFCLFKLELKNSVSLKLSFELLNDTLDH